MVMKFGTAFITGVFISISALFFFRQEETLFGFLSNKGAVNAAPNKDSSAQKKKPTASRVVKKTASISKQQAEHLYSPLFFSVSPITAIKTVDKTTAASNDVLNYTVTITNNGSVDA